MKKSFGTLPSGEETFLYTISCGKLSAAVTDYGATLVSLLVPDRDGVLADVGLVGFPNAGKSTLLSVVSAAKPKIADYAFTTLEPNLGIVEVRDGRSFVMADIPGIIEGAHEGRGLGTRFLRHIERNSILLFMIPATSENLRNEYSILLNELTQYNPELLDKERLLAVTKCDTAGEEELAALREQLPEGIRTVFISSVSGYNIPQLKDALWETLRHTNDRKP
mgnify:CR=1 FL=1